MSAEQQKGSNKKGATKREQQKGSNKKGTQLILSCCQGKEPKNESRPLFLSGFALKSGASRLGPIPLPHVTFGYGIGGNYVWAHGLGSGVFVTTTGASAGGYYTTLTGIPILAPGAIGAWVATQPNCTSCAHSAMEAFLHGIRIIR
ncbi:MAG: hypothetical protein ACI8P0_002161 [Planctomycetaceae bacterium]|jgi:hypothetical protein